MTAPDTIVRSMHDDDLRAVIRLHAQAFGHRDNSIADITAFYETLFGRCLSGGGERTSLVATRDGAVVGMVMGAPLRALLDGRPIDGVTATLFATMPGERSPAITRKLSAELIRRSGDLLLVDRANRDGRRVAEQRGLVFYPQYSLRWALPLSPIRALGAGLLNRRKQPGPNTIRAVDGVAGLADRLVGEPFRRVRGQTVSMGGLQARPLVSGDLVEQGPQILDGYRLTPDLSTPDAVADSWKWLDVLRPEGRHVRTAICRPSGELVGWFLLHIWPTGAAEVVQFAARPGCADRVIAGLVQEAERQGVASLHGSAAPAHLLALGECGAVFHARHSATGVHSANPDVHAAFAQGTAMLSGLEGEYPLQLASAANRRSPRRL